jgi:signal transduction histidine kinase/CheY-like chemotaxis protein
VKVRRDGLSWGALPRAAQLYVGVVIAVGAFALVGFFPHRFPRPVLFVALLGLSCLTSVWKINLPIALESGSTLSISYAADLMSLLLLGPQHAVVIAVAGVIAQCTVKVKRRYPPYRTAFSAAVIAIAMGSTAFVYGWLGGSTGSGSLAFFALATPLVGSIATYFVINTVLVAGVIAMTTNRALWTVWREDFLWSGANFMVVASAGAFAAVVIDHGEQWKAILMVAPVYVSFLTYQLFVSRLELLEREKAARESAEEANRLKDQFLAIVSHELRTPLNAILGWADLLRRGTIDGARRDRAYQAIYDSGKRQAHLIDELLDVARIMSGKLQVEPSAVNVRDIVDAAVEVVQPAADSKRVRIEVDAKPTIGTIFADSARLQQIVLNLLTNAVKFSPENGAVHVGIHRTPTFVEIVVGDSGQGISRDFLPFVFEPFRQADGSTTRRHGGLGLGLSIVRHLAEAHGGTVTVDSAGEGCGSTFVVQLPTGAIATSQSSPPVSEAIASLAGLSVLVVDDDDESRAIVAEYLHGHEAVVLTASSAGQAFDLLRREHVDVLLADIAMPGEDGYSLIKRIRETAAPATAAIPAAALTSFARDEDRQQALRAGFQLHLSKPVDPRSLVEAVANLGRNSRALVTSSS